jgi:glutamate---cysteine ligase / carboxylate-amine ligase
MKLPIFSAYGVELEYMIVDRETLAVAPISDRLIFDVAGQYQNEVEFGPIAWSNELVLHVIELKTNGPAQSLGPLPDYFQTEIQRINGLLTKYNAMLLPTGAHPWMDPFSEAKLWPHEQNSIYESYDRIFDCRGHGWSNLQSVHLNLPFANDKEFAQLHTAIRLLLPIIPALSASTPIIDGKLSGMLDTRLEFYRLNQQKIPSVTGLVVPELVLTQQQYCEQILDKMYQDIAPYDCENVLQEEWLNSRGAIARFDRNTIEIRVVDTQECPAADLAVLTTIVAVLKYLVAEKWQSFARQSDWSHDRLHTLFLKVIKEGLKAELDSDFVTLFGLEAQAITAGQLWTHLAQAVPLDDSTAAILLTILKHGNLAERIVLSLQEDTSAQKLAQVYQQLANCLQQGILFLPC